MIPDLDGIKRGVRFLDIGSRDDPHPIVILSGTAQNIDTYSPQFRALSKSRRLIIPELRCQGETQLLTKGTTMGDFVDDLEKILVALNLHQPDNPAASRTVDLVGFSFGGRVGMAAAAYKGHLVHKLSVSCVPLRRPALGCSIMHSWLQSLRHGEARSCYWSFLVNGYSERFIERHQRQFPLFVENISMGNPDPARLVDLLENTLLSADEAGDHSVLECARRIRCPVQVFSASDDRIAGLEAVLSLARAIDSCGYYVELTGGHLAPFESPVLWRNHLMEFLNSDMAHAVAHQ